jgi:hypothetical protein
MSCWGHDMATIEYLDRRLRSVGDTRGHLPYTAVQQMSIEQQIVTASEKQCGFIALSTGAQRVLTFLAQCQQEDPDPTVDMEASE